MAEWSSVERQGIYKSLKRKSDCEREFHIYFEIFIYNRFHLRLMVPKPEFLHARNEGNKCVCVINKYILLFLIFDQTLKTDCL